MTKGRNAKKQEEKLRIFRKLFTGLTNVSGTYNPASGRSWQIKAPVTDKVIWDHLAGRRPYGVYLLVKDRTRAMVIDFDTENQLAPMEFVDRAKHYGMPAYIERSKSKGYHVWIFFDGEVLASKARLVVNLILEEIGQHDTEVFPKLDILETNTHYGHFINTPLFGNLVPKGKTVFLNPLTFEAYLDQWAVLESVQEISETTLDRIIELNDLSPEPKYQRQSSGYGSKKRAQFSLPPCAQKMLSDGVSQYQRVSCFRLAVHLKRVGLPYDAAVSVLRLWAMKNKPTEATGIIEDSEILAQSSYAYERSYFGYGCESSAVKPFCDISCHVRTSKKGRKVNHGSAGNHGRVSYSK